MVASGRKFLALADGPEYEESEAAAFRTLSLQEVKCQNLKRKKPWQ
jgi:hypothetical protein